MKKLILSVLFIASSVLLGSAFYGGGSSGNSSNGVAVSGSTSENGMVLFGPNNSVLKQATGNGLEVLTSGVHGTFSASNSKLVVFDTNGSNGLRSYRVFGTICDELPASAMIGESATSPGVFAQGQSVAGQPEFRGIGFPHNSFSCVQVDYSLANKRWDGVSPFSFYFNYLQDQSTASVTWQGQSRCYSSGQARLGAFGTAGSVTTSGSLVNMQFIKSAVLANTPSGTYGKGAMCTFRFCRDSNIAGRFGGLSSLVSVNVCYTTDQLTDD